MVNEVQFGAGASLHECSASFCAKTSAGDLTVGDVSSASKTATLNPTADTYILSTSPDSNYGTANPISASASSYRAYLKFDTSAIPASATINYAKLTIYSKSTASGVFRVHGAPDSWTETGLTWNNAPAWQPGVLASSPPSAIQSNVAYTIFLPVKAVTKAGNTDLGIDFSQAGTITKFASREDATNPPQLVINYGGYRAQTGFNTGDEPVLEVITSSISEDMGVLDDATTGTAAAMIKVRNYLSDGYVLQIVGPAPGQGSHRLNALTTPTLSQKGVEQFGLNLVANTTPAIGANPAQVPSGTFSFGNVESGYNGSNYFKYVDGDIVARSLTSTGETDYTVSFIANVSNVTPAGRYNGSFSAVVTPVY
jgi:hypothetical protein